MQVRDDIQRLSPKEVLQALGTSAAGLHVDEARRRLLQYGSNRLPQLGRPSLLLRFLAQFLDFFALLLEVAGVITLISFVIGRDPYDLRTSLAIFAVVFINAVIGFVQEYRAERTAEALKRLLPAKAKVLRDGLPTEVLAEQLVPGDIVVLEEGDHISADCRVIQASEFATSDAALTGESEPVRRQAEPVLEDVPHIQARNLVFAGTNVARGTGRAAVFATGIATEFGKIYQLTAGVRDEPSPLQREVASAARRVAVIALLLGGLLFGLRLAAHAPFVQAFLYALGVIAALVPEGLPAVLSVSLAVGVQRMAEAKALVKRLTSVETLGSTTVICTDKTGTLTAGEMTVRLLWAGGREFEVSGVGYAPEGAIMDGTAVVSPAETPVRALLRAALFCNNARLLHDEGRAWAILGDPTEGALLVLAAKGGYDIDGQLRHNPRVRELPFDSQRRRMTVVIQEGQQWTAYAKGAPAELLARATRILDKTDVRELTEHDRHEIEAIVDHWAAQGLRVLGFATRAIVRDGPLDTTLEQDFTFIGLAGMQDPPRPEVMRAAGQAQKAGMTIFMITGDYGLTAEAIARKVGLVHSQHPRIITGADLAGMTDEQLQNTLRTAFRERQEFIFARVAPADKLSITVALRALDQIVAVTGDGVNDAPALKRADIGVAMGLAGTDVAKEAAVMILLDDSFATIVKAIEQGRAIYKNIRRFLVYLFTHNLGELFPVIFATFAGLPVIPINALQILAIDLGSDVLPALALGAEAPEPGLLDEPPRPRKERLMSAEVFKRFLFLGTIQAIGATAAFYFALYAGGWSWGRPLADTDLIYRQAITMTQAGIVFSQFFNGFAVRTDRESVFAVGLFSNRFLVLGEILGVAIMLAVSYLPPLQATFRTAAVPWYYWGVPAGFGVVSLIAEELRKAVVRRMAHRKATEG